MKPPFLTGDRVYIRAMTLEDKDRAVAWFNSVFPVNAERAERFLREEVTETFAARQRYLVVVRIEDDEIIGGIKLKTWDLRAVDLRIHMAPHLSPDDADQYKADALRLAIPWLRDEHEFMATTVRFADDEPACIAAAEEMDLSFGARFRGFLRRPGGRVDLLIYQALNRAWEATNA